MASTVSQLGAHDEGQPEILETEISEASRGTGRGGSRARGSPRSVERAPRLAVARGRFGSLRADALGL